MMFDYFIIVFTFRFNKSFENSKGYQCNYEPIVDEYKISIKLFHWQRCGVMWSLFIQKFNIEYSQF